MHKNKPHIGVTLTIIYLALATVSLAIYSLIKQYVNEQNQSIIVGLLGWSATLFATIALLYTFNSWREQKSLEVIAIEAKLIINELSKSSKISEDLFYSFMQNNLDLYKSNKSNLHNIIDNGIIFQLDTLSHLIYINNSGKSDENLNEVIFQHNQSYYLFNGKLNYVSENRNKLNSDDINKQIITAFGDHRDCNLKLKSYLANYALYKEYDS